MRNERTLLFSSLNVEQTDALLAGLDSLPVDDAVARRIRRNVEKAALPKRRRRKTAMRVLVPIAACLVAITLVFTCFPQAAQAIASFLGLNYTPSRYMSELPSSRTPVPSVDEALEAAAPSDGDYTITLLPEWDDAQAYVDYREQLGLEPFVEDDWAWLRDIRPEIAEVLYDGNTLIWNTNLYTTNEHVQSFMSGYIPGLDSAQSADAMLETATYTVEGDPTVYELDSSGGGLTPIFDDEERASADHVVLYSDFYLPDDQPLPSGILTITQTIRIAEDDAMSDTTSVARITHTFTFDTTAGNTQSADTGTFTVPLSGEIYLSASHMDIASDGTMDRWTIDTQKVSLDGVVLNVQTEYLATGIRVTITAGSVPEDWTEDMTNGLLSMTWRNIYDEIDGPGICADLYVDGTFVSGAETPDSWNNGELVYILPIFPEDYATTGVVTLKMTHTHYTTLNGTDQLAGEVYELPEGMSENVSEVETVPLTEIAIPLPQS